MPKARSLTAASTALDSDRRSVGASQKVSEAQAMPIGKRDSANLSGVSMPVVVRSNNFGGRSVLDGSSTDHPDPKAYPKFDLSLPCDPDFEFEDANVDLQAEGMHFWVHQHMLRDFQGLKARLDRAPRDEEQGWRLLALTDRAEDVRNMLLVLYSRPYEPHDFNTTTFESAFKLASKYGHQGIRSYTIQQLDRYPLQPIERFRLSRDYDVPQWMSRAITELSWRDKPITAAEARILGAEKIVEVAEKREALRFGLGRWSCNACRGTNNFQGEAIGDNAPVQPSTSKTPPEPTTSEISLELTIDVGQEILSAPDQAKAKCPQNTVDAVPIDTTAIPVENINARSSPTRTLATKPSFVFGSGSSSQFQL